MDKCSLQVLVLVLLQLTNATEDSFWLESRNELAKKVERGQGQPLHVDVSLIL